MTHDDPFAEHYRHVSRLHQAVALVLALLLWLAWLLPQGDIAPTVTTAPVIMPVAEPAPAPVAPVVPATVPAPVIAEPPKLTSPTVASLYYASGQHKAPANTATQLADWLQYLQATPEAKVQISGFHDKIGDLALNRVLAHNRAKAVRDALQAQGIAPDRLVIVAPAETWGGNDDHQARRVEVSGARF
jgi:K(+)-stimulated pyrophosphate-energized sodium pump